jgi:hypothetical protein
MTSATIEVSEDLLTLLKQSRLGGARCQSRCG